MIKIVSFLLLEHVEAPVVDLCSQQHQMNNLREWDENHCVLYIVLGE